MRTTLRLPDPLLRSAKRRALDEGTSLTRIFESALRAFLDSKRAGKPYRYRHVVHRGGRILPGVDINDRDSLHERMEGRR